MKLHLYESGLVCDLQIMHFTPPVKYRCVDKKGRILYYSLESLRKLMDQGNYEFKNEVEMNDI